MKKLVAAFVLLGMVMATPSYAAGVSTEPSLWERLRKKVELITPRKKLVTTNAAGGVRGSLADADDVYWKGEQKVQSVDVEELDAFKKAMNLAGAGKNADAQAAFSEFVKLHPESSLRADADAALTLLQTSK
ncbi:MAG: hypothetical protein HOP24_07275 [Sideroxydans sp.]|nr:hypothetical protein [Sideroxydans sp.]